MAVFSCSINDAPSPSGQSASTRVLLLAFSLFRRRLAFCTFFLEVHFCSLKSRFRQHEVALQIVLCHALEQALCFRLWSCGNVVFIHSQMTWREGVRKLGCYIFVKTVSLRRQDEHAVVLMKAGRVVPQLIWHYLSPFRNEVKLVSLEMFCIICLIIYWRHACVPLMPLMSGQANDITIIFNFSRLPSTLSAKS